MKIRTGFVSNSSSSSFTCNVCGENQSGMDLFITDAGMRGCAKGHYYCIHHEVKDIENLTIEEKRKSISHFWSYKNENISGWTDTKVEEKYQQHLDDGEFNYEGPTAICPVCQLVSITDKVMVQYLIYKSGKKREELEQELKSEFHNLEELIAKI